MSAVDAHSGAHIWQHCITGALAGKARLLVLHERKCVTAWFAVCKQRRDRHHCVRVGCVLVIVILCVRVSRYAASESVDRVVVLDHGTIAASGCYRQVESHLTFADDESNGSHHPSDSTTGTATDAATVGGGATDYKPTVPAPQALLRQASNGSDASIRVAPLTPWEPSEEPPTLPAPLVADEEGTQRAARVEDVWSYTRAFGVRAMAALIALVAVIKVGCGTCVVVLVVGGD